MSRNTIIPFNPKNFTQQVQLNYLLQSKTRFLYGQTVNYLKTEILRSQSCANLLRLSSLKGWIQDSALSPPGFLVLTSQIRYIAPLVLSTET